MACTCCDRRLGFYYGPGLPRNLIDSKLAVLQPDQVTSRDLAVLRERGVRPLAYLSIGEDTGPDGPWQLSERNPLWGGALVNPGHPEWVCRVIDAAVNALSGGFGGFFVDTIDAAAAVSREGTVCLLKELRRVSREAYILANRGFAVLPEAAWAVDGIVFEGFSTGHTPDYSILPDCELDANAMLAHYLRILGKDLWALDYGTAARTVAFARDRALAHGLCPVVGDKNLTCLSGPLCDAYVRCTGCHVLHAAGG